MIALLGSVALSQSVTAQDATPGANGEPPGVTFTPLAFGQAQQVMLPNAQFVLFRLTIDPGAEDVEPDTDPSIGLVYVESGTVTITTTAPVSVLRNATLTAMMGGESSATPPAEGASPFEQIEANTEFQLAPGDSVLVPGNVGGDLKNQGSDQVVLLIANVGPPEDDQATPVS